MNRGEVWWASLPAPSTSEPGYRRPVLIVQSDAFNKSAIGTVIVAAITKNQRLAAAPGNVRITTRQSGLRQASVVNVSQLLTVGRVALTEKIGRLPAAKMSEVENGLLLVLGLSTPLR